jgi:ribonuclease HII
MKFFMASFFILYKAWCMAPSLKLEKSFSGIVCGIDEAGRGPWCGPVVAAAVIVGPKVRRGIKDSKQLPEPRREELYSLIMNSYICGVGEASVEEIDSLNILNATKLAMLRAYESLPVKAEYALVDGNQLPSLPCKMQYVINGDDLCHSIAAASIIAKVTRDRILRKLAVEFPHYNWHSNKGYGTKCHQQAIEKHGLTIHHRKSWGPVKERMEFEAAS